MIIWILVAKKRIVHSLELFKPELSNLTNMKTTLLTPGTKLGSIIQHIYSLVSTKV